MIAPRQIETTLAVYADGTEVWRSPGCNEPFCQRRNPEGDVLEICPWLSFVKDFVKPGGLQEICNKKDAE